MLFAAAILASSIVAVEIDPNRQIGNPVVCSANGRYCVVTRLHDGIPDFTTERAGKVFGLDDLPEAEPEPEENEWVELAMEDDPEPEPEPEPKPEPAAEAAPEPAGESPFDSTYYVDSLPPVPATVTAAVYDNRRFVTTLRLPNDRIRDVFVSDSGRFLVLAPQPGGPWGLADWKEVPAVTVYRTDGSPVGEVMLGEIVSEWDRRQMQYGPLQFELRRDVLVIGMPGPHGPVERRVDLATATVLDPNTPIYPLPRVTVMPTPDAERQRAIVETAPDCAAAFDDPALVRLDSAAFFRRAISTPVPEYPILGIKALISGPVRVEAVVSPWGEVTCVRSSGLPFGMSAAVRKAIGTWRFRPLFAGGRRVAFAGDVVFRYTQ